MPRKKKPTKPCERCTTRTTADGSAPVPRDAVRGERFCARCRAELLREMREAGYLEEEAREWRWTPADG